MSVSPRTIRIAAIALAAACCQVSAQDANEPGIIIGSACADIWATETREELDALAATLNSDYQASLDSANAEAYALDIAYLTAADEYRAKYVATINAILDLAGKAGDQSLWEKAWEEGQERPKLQSEFDVLVDAVVAGKGVDVLSHATDLLVSDATVDQALTAEHAAKEAVIAARRAVLAKNAQIAGIEAVVVAVEVCTEDQEAFLGGRGPDPET